MCLGESLVRTGIMSNEALNEAISDFQAQIIAQETLVRAEIGNHPLAKGLLVTLDLTLRFFYRLGYAIHIVGRCDSAPDYVEYLFCSEQNFKKGNARYMAVGMSSIFFDSVAQSPGIHQRFDKPSPNATENMAQLMFNLNYMVCKKMKQLGMRVTHGAAFMDASAHGGATGVCVEMESLTGPMVLTYSDQPPGSVSFDM